MVASLGNGADPDQMPHNVASQAHIQKGCEGV